DVAGIVFAINEGGAVFDLDIGEFPKGDLLAVGGGDENAADLFGCTSVRLGQTDHQIELLFALHHLSGCRAADGSLDQPVNVGDIQAVARNFRAIDIDRQTRLPQLLHERDVFDTSHLF